MSQPNGEYQASRDTNVWLMAIAGIAAGIPAVSLMYVTAEGKDGSRPLNPWLRWSSITLLLAVTVYVFVVPH